MITVYGVMPAMARNPEVVADDIAEGGLFRQAGADLRR